MYSSDLLLVLWYSSFFWKTEIFKHDDFSKLTFSEQPLSGLFTVSMVNEHLLKSGHWRQMMKGAKLVLNYSAINVVSSFEKHFTLITSAWQSRWSLQYTWKHSGTSLAYILIDWILHWRFCFKLTIANLFCSLEMHTKSPHAPWEHLQVQSPSSRMEFCCT